MFNFKNFIADRRKNQKNNLYVQPLLYLNSSLVTDARKIIVLLFVQIVLLFLSSSYKAMIVIATCTLGSVLANLFNTKSQAYTYEKNYSYELSLIQGLITGFLLPETFPPVSAFLFTFCFLVLYKHLFGGFSSSIVNPCVITVISAYIIGREVFPQIELTYDILASRNPSQFLIENGVFPILPFDSSITDSLNSSIFALFKVSVPDGFVSLFWDSHSIIPAFRFNFVTLLSSIVIFSEDFNRTIIPGLFILIYLLLVRFVSPFFFNGILFQGDMILALLTSGTIFISLYILSWFGTVPASTKGKIIYGILGGILNFFITGCGTSSIGTLYTILILNIVSVFIQQVEDNVIRSKTRKLIELYKKEENI